MPTNTNTLGAEQPGPSSEEFEQQIHRIHELLEGSDATVTWNDHIPDPDNPRQPRQIDITIQKNAELTLVECRIHRNRQNVKWIEELIGRRISLKADHVLAVSSSGFTKGACIKAAKHGIVLRDFRSLTDDEIFTWDRSVDLTLLFFQYSNIDIQFLFDLESLARIDPHRLARELRSSPAILRSAFHQAGKLLGTRGIDPNVNWPVNLKFRAVPQEDVYLCGQKVMAMEMHAGATLISREIKCPAVRAYGAPEITSHDRNVVVENFDLGETSVIHDNERVSILVDLRLLNMPPLTQFRYCKTFGKREMDFDHFEIAGIDAIGISPGPMQFRVGSYVDPAVLHTLPPTTKLNL